MSERAALRLAWGLAALAFVLMLSSSVVSGIDVGDIFIWAIALVFAGVGVLIASRQPGQRDRLDLPGGGRWPRALGAVTHSFADHWVDGNGGPEALGKAAALYGEVSWIPFILMPATFLLLLFPDGRLLSRRWRPVAGAPRWASRELRGGGLAPGAIPDFPQVMNPIGVEQPAASICSRGSPFSRS